MQQSVFWRSAAAFQPVLEWSKVEVCLWGYCFFHCRGFLWRAGIVWKAAAQNDLRVTREVATPLKPKPLWLSDFAVSNALFWEVGRGAGGCKLHLFQQAWLWKPQKRQTMLPHSVKLWFITKRRKKKKSLLLAFFRGQILHPDTLRFERDFITSLLISVMLRQIHTPISVKANKSQCNQVDVCKMFQKEISHLS